MEDAPRYPQRLGRNIASYQGETIDIHKLLRDVQQVAKETGWQPIPLVVSPELELPAFQRVVARPRKTIYFSSGTHGDEPAGPLCVLRLFEENAWPEDVTLFVIPCLNPGGFARNTRENEDGVDLNRDYRSRKTALVRAHIRWFEQRPRFDLSMCLHEDWESHGFYVYELNPDLQPSLAAHIVERVKQVCPIDMSELIEGREACGGVICANRYLGTRPDWPEAFYLIHHKTRLSYTLEGPSDFPLLTRVNALATGARAAFEALQ
ncbi:MAG: M14 family metallocarboxypeptidase [Verrucomicrobia subdivision 3 bacterium]|nr:M14 family metallocarboxypeptidase [Limisphaerales bacterium]